MYLYRIMSLLKSLSFSEYKSAQSFSKETCEIVAKLANLKLTFIDVQEPGKLLIKALDRSGCSEARFKQLVAASHSIKTVPTYYKPYSKVALLIANDKYENLSKLATPSLDCESLAAGLKELGFIVILIKNSKTEELRKVLDLLLGSIPEDSYCFIFYAGHGCEICNTKCILGIDCPEKEIQLENCITENEMLNKAAKCKPELCLLVMDMCRIDLDRLTNPKIYSELPFIEPYSTHSNLLICYSTQSSKAAYEVLQIECSTTIDVNITYELQPGDTGRIVPCASQYVSALCSRLHEDCDISRLLDKVHSDVENAFKKQRPIKVQCGVTKHSLYDPVKGDTMAVLQNMQDILKPYTSCSVL